MFCDCGITLGVIGRLWSVTVAIILGVIGRVCFVTVAIPEHLLYCVLNTRTSTRPVNYAAYLFPFPHLLHHYH